MDSEFKKCYTFWKCMDSLKVIEELAPASHIHGLPEKVEMERGWSSLKHSDDTTCVPLHIYKVTGAHVSPHSSRGVVGCVFGSVC